MKLNAPPRRHPFFAAIALLVIVLVSTVTDATAQARVIRLTGDIYDTKGGPFVAPNVYVIASTGGSCCGRVPAGKTLTIQKGAIVKFGSLIGLRVGIQGIAATQQNLFFGATTNLWRIAVVAIKKR